ncbi:MAG: UDP-2,3-diacylglucosamine diphosphatase LpxG [Parachlamydiaceae bacterium]|nr:UDP-2,3-diacylglucosamine diphosphatase LpxG [Parachlamydiaceae bacterium]
MNLKKSQIAWDLWCIFSVIGVWPRFIEPNLLKITSLTIKIPLLPKDLEGFKILHFSDLHWHGKFSNVLAKKLIKKIASCQPDLIVFTGDFICRSKLDNKEKLKVLLNQIYAPYGCYAVLGNHDYSHFVTVNQEGDYAVEEKNDSSDILRGFKRLFNFSTLSKKITDDVRKISYHSELLDLLNETSFQVLNNETKQINVKGTQLNICGLEEYTTGRLNPKAAFEKFNKDYPGIILTHNPDAIKTLNEYPGNLILSGHTHGGQINIPWMWKKFTRIENLDFKRGHLRFKNSQQAYVNRGISSIMKFRWGSIPELTLITLQEE